MPPPATCSTSSSPPSPSPSAASSISSSSGSSSSSSTLFSASLSASTSPLTSRTRLCWRAPPPSPRRRPLPYQWMHPTTTTPISTSTTTTILTPTTPASSSLPSRSVVDRAAPNPTASPSLIPSSYDPLTSLRLSAFMNDSSTSISAFERPPRIRQNIINNNNNNLTFQRLTFSAPCSPVASLTSRRPSQLVFASGAVGTASGLGHVFGRPLQAKETIPCSPLNCTQWQKEPPQSLAQQAQSPSHTFQQQCAVHKRFRLFRQRPRRCQVHASGFRNQDSGTTSVQGAGRNKSNGPNYILPPTTVYPLVVRPDKILLDHHEQPPVQESWWPTLTSSISMSSRLSFSSVSLSLSTTNTTTSSASYQTHGSEDDESFLSTGGSYHSSGKSSKKLSKKERQLQKQLQKQEQQRQQQQQQKLRCLCYLDTSLDHQLQLDQLQQPQQPQQKQQQSKGSSWHPQKNSSKEKEKEKEAGRFRRIWNESVVNFHKSKTPASSSRSNSRSRQSSSPSPSPSSSGYHHTTVTGTGEHSGNSQTDDAAMRRSLSGTDISDEGNHSLSDIEDDLLEEQFRHLRHGTTATPPTSSNSNSSYGHHRVSFQGPYGASSAKSSSAAPGTTTTPRPKDDLKAIARHQAELSLQQHQEGPFEENNNNDDDDFRYSMDLDDDQVMASLPPPPPPVLSNFGSHISSANVDEDEDDEDEDWDIQSDSGAPSSSPMYSADVREPTCRSTLALPMSSNPNANKAYLKKPSNTNLNSSSTLRSRQRCLSLPADTTGPSGFLKMSSSTPSENWDEDFDIGGEESIHVPSKVVENQMSLQMDLYNIKDFASQIEDLKTLRASLRMASSSLKATNPKKHQDLSVLFQRDWEQAEVIIDLGEIAQTSPTTTSPPSLTASGKKASEPSLADLSTGAGSNLASKPSMGFKPRRPVLSTSAPANNNHLNAPSPFQNQQEQEARSDSQSSNLTGTTLVSSGDAESDTCPSTRTSSRASSSASTSASLKVDIEAAVARLTVSHQASTSSPPQGVSGRTNNGMRMMRQQPSTAYMKESYSSPAGLGLCTTPISHLRTSTNNNNRNSTSSSNEDEVDEYDDELEINYENASIGILRFPEGEQPLHRGGGRGGFHGKEDSSATVKPLSPRSPKEGGGSAFQSEMEASFRRYQKYSHYSKRRTTGGLPNSRRPTDDDRYYDEDEDEDEEDDGYESYGYDPSNGGSSSIGIFTPIPSDRHMQVLKDILMEGLGTEVARQYMFKQGEQDHVRFSVEVIPGLLGHLKGLQQRLGDQLMELQSLTVIV
ncbi:hypothetical protein BGZ96_003456 [Linnemannia gamsii]|uniref:Uncharacterized protein n=1 Tax=Linnemannia gamsii TaxID=64522 RepID=A0ABQ7JJ93_9FUNG|nr:hypothetical protein BGZ96_003456 [Linnemannia gamsii]